MNKKELYLVNLDLSRLDDDMRNNSIEYEEWFAIVEAFIESFEKVKEVSQLLSISRLHVPNPTQKLLKAVFERTDDERLIQITDRVTIDSTEYYDKLLTCEPTSVESKIRLVFSYRGSQVSMEWLESIPFVVLQIRQLNEDVNFSGKSILDDFTSVSVVEELDLTIEEAFYQRKFQPSNV